MFFNCILTCSTIIPIWMSAKQLHLKREARIILIAVVLLWPDLAVSSTFMAENIYWPIFGWYIYIWLLNRDKENSLVSFLKGFLGYIGFFAKEVFLTVILADLAFEIVYPLLQRMQKEERLACSIFSFKNIKHNCIFIGTFIGLYFFTRFLIFGNQRNIYTQAIIPISQLSITSIRYCFYGFLYNLSAVLLSCFIFPIIIPFVEFKCLKNDTKELFVFISLLLLIAIATITYTITLREDLGLEVPRLHMRYISPAFPIAFIPFFEVVFSDNNTCQKSDKRPALLFISLLVCLGCYWVFKGISPHESCVDEFTLRWIQLISTFFKNHITGQTNRLNIKIIFCISLVTVIVLLYYSIPKHSRLVRILFLIGVVMVSITNNALAYRKIYNTYQLPIEMISETESLDDFFFDIGNDETKLYITNASGYSVVNQCTDTYFDDVKNFYFIDPKQISYLEANHRYAIKDLSLHEALFGTTYNEPSTIDYIIIERGADFGLRWFDNTVEIPELSGEFYNVYKNLNPNYISLSSDLSSMTIYLTQENNNAAEYITCGISGTEGDFTWMDGTKMQVIVPVNNNCRWRVTIYILGTFNGLKNYEVHDIHDSLITQGAITDKDEVSFELDSMNGELFFEFLSPEAEFVKQVYPTSEDDRQLSFQLIKIRIEECKEQHDT